jgi:hypothetical protein
MKHRNLNSNGGSPMDKRWLMLVLLMGVLLAGCSVANAATPQDREVSWEEAIEILNSGEVQGVYQLHSREVTLHLKDGSWIKTTEPGLDDIFREVEKCGSVCEGVTLATE